MFMISGRHLMTEDQAARWDAQMERMRALQAEGGDDPWLFHGTGQDNALKILNDGFDPTTSWVFTRQHTGGSGRPEPCVFWTKHANVAENHAIGKTGVERGGFPVIFAARASDIIASGTAVPDRNSWVCNTDEDPELEPTSWQDSLERLGAIAVLDCRHVANLQMASLGPLDERPDPAVHQKRLNEFWAKAPKPDVSEEALAKIEERIRQRRVGFQRDGMDGSPTP